MEPCFPCGVKVRSYAFHEHSSACLGGPYLQFFLVSFSVVWPTNPSGIQILGLGRPHCTFFFPRCAHFMTLSVSHMLRSS